MRHINLLETLMNRFTFVIVFGKMVMKTAGYDDKINFKYRIDERNGSITRIIETRKRSFGSIHFDSLQAL